MRFVDKRLDQNTEIKVLEKNWYEKIAHVDYAETELEKLKVVKKLRKFIIEKRSIKGITFKKLDHRRLNESAKRVNNVELTAETKILMRKIGMLDRIRTEVLKN